jgi:hypothetical protein
MRFSIYLECYAISHLSLSKSVKLSPYTSNYDFGGGTIWSSDGGYSTPGVELPLFILPFDLTVPSIFVLAFCIPFNQLDPPA